MDYNKTVVDLQGDDFQALTKTADAFICAAGFEARARRVPIVATVERNPLIVRFKNGPQLNEATFERLWGRFKTVQGADVCELDLHSAEQFELRFEEALRQLRNLATGRFVLDISGFPNFAICLTVIQIRRVFPAASLVLLHTEAEEYFPRKADFERIEDAAAKHAMSAWPEYLSARAVSMLIPSMFSGVALGHNDTCLIVFAGYEPHRTCCAIEATNPSKLVMVYGEPRRADLKWRQELSQIMHRGIDAQIMKTEEVSSTSEVVDNLRLLRRYYDYLYDDHVLSVCPINSKMQAVASALAWETYPDIQLTFPIPAVYLPKRFSVKWRDTFSVDLGCAPTAGRFLQSTGNANGSTAQG